MEQLKTVQGFSELDPVPSAQVAVLEHSRGVRCHAQPIKQALLTVIHLVLVAVTGENDVVHQS